MVTVSSFNEEKLDLNDFEDINHEISTNSQVTNCTVAPIYNGWMILVPIGNRNHDAAMEALDFIEDKIKRRLPNNLSH